MPQPNRNFDSQEYRYGFQGQEKDSEIKGEGLSVNYKYRMHDPRLGRFFTVDPLYRDFPWNSTYAFSENKVIHKIELEGLESTEHEANVALGEIVYWMMYKDFGNASNIAKSDKKELLGNKWFRAIETNTEAVSALKKAQIRQFYFERLSKGKAERFKRLFKPLVENLKYDDILAIREASIDAYNEEVLMIGKTFVHAYASGSGYYGLSGLPIPASRTFNLPKVVSGTYKGFTAAEGTVINEASALLKSEGLNVITEAAKKGQFAEVKIGERVIVFEPELGKMGASAITLTEEGGFALGPAAFNSTKELTKTLLHELHRLRFSDVVKTGSASANSASTSTKQAFEFAEEAVKVITKE
jgi:RHS repeat-associated protein